MLYRPTAGEIQYRGRSVHSLHSRRDLLHYRSQVQMVFQDPYSSMNPVFRVSHGVMRNLKLHRPELGRSERRQEAERVFTLVGLTPAAEMLRKFPYEMSGGQRQRVGFAQAVAVRPKLILADEPVSMLDVSIRAGILNLMADLREREGVSILYITHDIASARYVADRIMVMYGGHIVEAGPTETVLSDPRHPYTQLLLSAVPDPREPISVSTSPAVGEPPKVVNPGEGCRFRERCPLAIEVCSRVTPRLTVLAPAHSAACHVAAADAGQIATSAG
jgi:peptide/nickel transport system ATP-binding protein